MNNKFFAWLFPKARTKVDSDIQPIELPFASIASNQMLAVRALIGKKVNVEICCYAYGFIYPDENILVDVNETEYVFKSDEIDSEDHLWRFPIKDKDCCCEVSLA